MPENCHNLEDLWKLVARTNQEHFPDNSLMPIVGNGNIKKPKFMFVFINPTHANISSDPEWKGSRFPFIGTKPVWRIFHRAGLFDNSLMSQIEKSNDWSLELTDNILRFLKSQSFYFTNIVKWTGYDATLPNSEKIKLFLPILEREINIVLPEYIVTFGLIPFENITSEKIKLSEYYRDIMKSRKPKLYSLEVGNVKTNVIPCYFPVGRGDPKKAVEILQLLRKSL